MTGAALMAAPARADVVVLSSAKDCTVLSEDGALSNCAGDFLFAGNTKDGFARRGLIAFDAAAAVPSGATIDAVELALYVSRTKAQNENVSLYRLLSDWSEGTSHPKGDEGKGIAATSLDATWTYAVWSSTQWSTLGGDFDPSPSATASVGRDGSFYTWSSAQLIADVQGWVDDPSSNFGWLIGGNESGSQTAKRFDSHDSVDTTRRPTLTVTFTTGATTGACCSADGSCGVVLDPGLACTEGAYQGSGTVCSPNPCVQPTGACCLPTASASCLLETAADCQSLGGTFRGAFSVCDPNPCPVVLTPFLDPLPRPPVAEPVVGVPGGAAEYTIAMQQYQQQLHSELPPTTVWGYSDGVWGGYPGPTLETTTDVPIQVTWVNDLRDTTGSFLTTHPLPVDHCLHGAATGDPRTVVHLHGGHVPMEFDGYPESTFLPGEQVVYEYPNWQDAATLWYHDHALGITRLNVQMGLAGFYIIRDSVEAALGLPEGEFEVPLVIQDRSFNADGSFRYPSIWQEHFFGDTVLVNGKVWPYLEVKQGKYRLRILNGSNSRTYTLALSGGAAFAQIGSDGGLLPAPVALSSLTIGPGERADVIVDFGAMTAGTEILMTNSAPAPYPTGGAIDIANVMKFVVLAEGGDTVPIPATLRPVEPLSEASAVLPHREFHLEKFDDPCTDRAWLINGLGWHDVTEFPKLGTTEIWQFINRSGVMHPMHMHLVFFQVLDHQPFEIVDGDVQTTGPRVAPPPGEAGWKDTVQVPPFEIVRVIAHFEDFVGRYAYHCHILEHEDHEMMRQFETQTSCGDGARGIPLEECDDGDQDTSDACPDGPAGTCQAAFCGDAFTWNTDGGTEACDDAGESTTCDPDCTFAVCGDSYVNATAGETCDDGNASVTDSCPDGVGATCRFAVCGDGFVWSGTEVCDDAGASASCDADCTPAECGDGTTNGLAGEACDDSGESATCDADCTEVACGDGATNSTAGEACDDGGESASCDADCSLVNCGDGTTNVTAGESCDDGSESATCDADCTAAACGDGTLNATAGEQCDLGDVVPGDGCSATCQLESCGNGTIDPGEACDDGGQSASCDADCTPAECGDGTINAAAGEACEPALDSACGASCSFETADGGLPDGGLPDGGGVDGGSEGPEGGTGPDGAAGAGGEDGSAGSGGAPGGGAGGTGGTGATAGTAGSAGSAGSAGAGGGTAGSGTGATAGLGGASGGDAGSPSAGEGGGAGASGFAGEGGEGGAAGGGDEPEPDQDAGPDSDDPVTSDSTGGCGCQLPRRAPGEPAMLIAGVLALALARRRRALTTNAPGA